MLTVRFGEFVFHAERRQLLRGGEPVHLEPKAFLLLAVLLSRRPNAVSKRDIHEAIWPRTSVSESSLPGLAADLRTALGEDPAEPKLIRTVRGYGYAFCGTTHSDALPAGQACRWVALRAGQEIPLPEGTHLIGRDERCLVRCESVRVSRRHARLHVTPERVILEDLGSRNGTWVRGERVHGATEVRTGEAVRIGSEIIQFMEAGPDASTATDGDSRQRT